MEQGVRITLSLLHKGPRRILFNPSPSSFSAIDTLDMRKSNEQVKERRRAMMTVLGIVHSK
jgi:hypothetical protein